MKQVTKSEFYASFSNLMGITTSAKDGNVWEVRHHGILIAISMDRDAIGEEVDYFIKNK